MSNHVWPWSNADILTDCEPTNSQILSEQQKKKLAPLLPIILTSQQFYLFDVKEAFPPNNILHCPFHVFWNGKLDTDVWRKPGQFLNQLGQP